MIVQVILPNTIRGWAFRTFAKEQKNMRLLINLTSFVPVKMRTILYRLSGIKNTKGVSMASRIWSDFPQNVYLSNSGHIGRGTEFHIGYGNATITIGKNVWIAPNVHLYCCSHIIGCKEKRAGENTYRSINIGDGCWIGADSIVLGGVNIGNSAVVAAGSIVTKSIPCNEMWGGYSG